MSTLNDRRTPARSPAGARRRATTRPHLEALEGRALLTTFVVNSVSDVLNPPSGTETLRSAIQKSNSSPGGAAGNEIDLAVAGTYKITLPGANTGTNNSGAFAILPTGGNLTVRNTSGGGVTIDGNSIDRVFDINPTLGPAFSVKLVGLTIQQGVTGGSGGGIRDQGSANLDLTGVVIVNCTAGGNGGGVAMLNGGSPALSVTDSAFFNNTAGGGGGGIYAPGSGTITNVGNSLFQGNTAHDGGAIKSPGTRLALTNATLDGNHAVGGNGGGLDVNDPAGGVTINISNTLFTNNTAESGVNPPAAGTGNGGAIHHTGGDMDIQSAQFVANAATGGGGAVYSGGRLLSILSSTFNGNAAGASRGAVNPNPTPGDGGALAFSDTGTNAAFTGSQVVNSTFTLNTATGGGGAIADAGPGDLAVVNDTINANNAGGSGGGLLLGGSPSGVLNAQNTIFYGNTKGGGGGGGGGTGPDVATPNGSSVTDLGGNLVGTVGAVNGNAGFGAGALTANPLLAPLVDNGGLNAQFAGVNSNIGGPSSRQVVQTEALALNSPAIGKGVSSGRYLGVDGRNFPRPGRTSPSAPSIGAYEPQVTTLASLDVVIENDNNAHTRALDPSGSGNPGPGTGYPQLLAGGAKEVAATRFGLAGSTEVFVIGTDDQVYAQTISAGNYASGYVKLSSRAAKSISAGTDLNGNPILYIVSTDADANQLYEVKFDASGKQTSGGFTIAAFGNFKSTVLTHDNVGNPLLFAQSNVADKTQVYELLMTADGAPNGALIKVNYGQVKELAVSHDASNAPEIFVVGGDDSISYLRFSGDGSQQLTRYVGFGGPLRAISATNAANGNPILFGVGGDGQLYSHKFNANGIPTGGFNGIKTSVVPGGVKASYAGVDANRNPSLFVLSATDNTIYAAPFTATGDFVGPFTRSDTSAVTPVKRFVLA